MASWDPCGIVWEDGWIVRHHICRSPRGVPSGVTGRSAHAGPRLTFWSQVFRGRRSGGTRRRLSSIPRTPARAPAVAPAIGLRAIRVGLDRCAAARFDSKRLVSISLGPASVSIGVRNPRASAWAQSRPARSEEERETWRRQASKLFAEVAEPTHRAPRGICSSVTRAWRCLRRTLPI